MTSRRQHRAVGVHDGDDPRGEGDGVPLEPIRISTAIEPLVVVAHDVRHGFQDGNAAQEIVPDLNMRTDQLTLSVQERSRFIEHAIADADLADIVQQSAVINDAPLIFGQAEPFGDNVCIAPG